VLAKQNNMKIRPKKKFPKNVRKVQVVIDECIIKTMPGGLEG